MRNNPKDKKPKPQLIETEEGWKVTDGWIDDIYFEVVKQPSKETIKILHEFFYEIGMENLKAKGGQA